MEKTYKIPAIVWLKVTDYMHGWIQYELGGGARIGSQLVVSVQHIDGAREVLRMETDDDVTERRPVGNAMSATRRNVLIAGLDIDAAVMEKEYGMTRETMTLFVPVECPPNCMTKSGVLRPWTNDVCLGREQAAALQGLLRREFWKAVEVFNADYAVRMHGEKYPSIDMVEAFCRQTKTPDLYAEAIKREWNRRVARGDNCKIVPERKQVSLLDEL